MGRPTKPLISRERAARAALGVIDVHGLETLSLELVANRLGVKAPSLYYHFKHKAELLAEVARLILIDVQAPDPKTHWKQALLALAVATRRSILQHPNAAPLLLQFFPRHLLLAAYDHWIEPCSLPPEKHLILLEGLEKLTFGAALFEAAYRSRSIEPMPQFDRARLPNLAKALRSNMLGEEALFMATLQTFLDGFSMPAAIEATPLAATLKKTARKPASAAAKPRVRRARVA